MLVSLSLGKLGSKELFSCFQECCKHLLNKLELFLSDPDRITVLGERATIFKFIYLIVALQRVDAFVLDSSVRDFPLLLCFSVPLKILVGVPPALYLCSLKGFGFHLRIDLIFSDINPLTAEYS